MAEREPHGISPEDIAPTEDTTTGTADGPDVYAANRELERWLYGGVNQDNDDRLPTTPGLRPDWRDDAHYVGRVIYAEERDEAGKVVGITETWKYPDRSQREEQTPQPKE
ncbi:MAG: hypothetical protein AAB478_00905 [Patescibacteria group bacterium]